MAGLFITFEGGDGAGKTTQAELLGSWLVSRGYEVLHTREPGGTTLGAALRNLLLHGESVDPRAEALLYAADRAQHIAEIVRPALQRGAAVVQDRYIDSSLAYQGAGRTLDVAEVQQLSEWATESLKPRFTVLLDVSPELAAARRQAEGTDADRLESESVEFHERVRQGFLQLAAADPHRYIVLDADNSPEDLHEAIVAHIAPLLRP